MAISAWQRPKTLNGFTPLPIVPTPYASTDYSPSRRGAYAPAQAADMTRSSPGINRNAKDRPPLDHATVILLIVLVESAARMGEIASAGFIFPDATSEAIETAAECVSAKPANAAPTITPISPKVSCKTAETTKIPDKVVAKIIADKELNGCPACAYHVDQGARSMR